MKIFNSNRVRCNSFAYLKIQKLNDKLIGLNEVNLNLLNRILKLEKQIKKV